MAYEVVGVLGRGGSAIVDLAIESGGGRLARKRLALTGSAAEIDISRRRLRREAEILARLDHPAIVPLYGVEDDGTDVVLIMPALAASLADRVRAYGPLSPAETLRTARSLFGALAAAHRQGVVHRDIKPSNVLFDHEGRPALADFGVAMTRHLTQGLTLAGAVVGTPEFMAPEQARGEVATHAADVFALGATLLYALTGQGPFGSGPPAAVLWRAAEGRVVKVPTEVPQPLRGVLAQILAPRPEDRPDAVAVLRTLGATAELDLVSQLTGGGDLAGVTKPAMWRRVVRWRPREPWAADRPRWKSWAGWATFVIAIVVVGSLLAIAATSGGSKTATREGGAQGAISKATTPTTACTAEPYHPCGQPVAPHTNGESCQAGWYDLNGLPADGCEAHSDYLPGTELTSGTPIRANLVPAASVDSFNTTVSGHATSLCWGTLTVTLTAPASASDQLNISHDGKVVATAISTDGIPAKASVSKPSCFGNDSETLNLSVSELAGASSADFILSRSGGW